MDELHVNMSMPGGVGSTSVNTGRLFGKRILKEKILPFLLQYNNVKVDSEYDITGRNDRDYRLNLSINNCENFVLSYMPLCNDPRYVNLHLGLSTNEIKGGINVTDGYQLSIGETLTGYADAGVTHYTYWCDFYLKCIKDKNNNLIAFYLDLQKVTRSQACVFGEDSLGYKYIGIVHSGITDNIFRFVRYDYAPAIAIDQHLVALSGNNLIDDTQVVMSNFLFLKSKLMMGAANIPTIIQNPLINGDTSYLTINVDGVRYRQLAHKKWVKDTEDDTYTNETGVLDDGINS